MSGTRRCCELAALIAATSFVLGAGSGAAQAAPEWGISIEHHNAYGQQAAECATHQEEFFVGEPERDCGVDPFTGSGVSFDRGSGDDQYAITVQNTGTDATGTTVGSSLTCTAGTWTGTPAPIFNYQWLRNGAPISKAVEPTYVTQAEDSGAAIQCEAVGKSSEGEAVSFSPVPVTVAPSPGPPPLIENQPTITGAATVGAMLSCSQGNWSNSPTSYAYRWYRNGLPVLGAMGASYAVQAADRGSVLQCAVTATNSAGQTTSATLLAKEVLFSPPTAAVKPSITGTATKAEESVSCTSGTWNGSPTVSYQWIRNGAAIGGATTPGYTLTGADEGQPIQCEVTAANSEGTATAITGAIGATGAPNAPAAITVSGTRKVNKTLTCQHGAWGNTPDGYEYSWLRDGTPILGTASGATTTATDGYKLTASDLGATVQCQVVAANSSGTVVAVSASTTGVEAEYPTPPTKLSTAATVASPATASVADELPGGLELAAPEGPSTRVSGAGWNCAAPTTRSFTCRRYDALVPGEAFPPIYAYVHVSQSLEANVTDTATVSGGGAASSTTTASPTVIASVPFGIATFSTNVSEGSGEPFTQAGGHPFAATASFVLNYVPSDVEALLMTAGGVTVKSAEVALPPGFLGDPENAEKCGTPTELLACPRGSIVGYALPALGAAAIAEGVAKPFAEARPSAVWSLAPQPGHVAEFGFVVAGGVPLILSAHVRSDGDYGISIGDAFTGRNGPNPLGFTFTLCGDGVTGSVEGGTLIGGSCATTPQDGVTGPFLTMPTSCAGPVPVTTLRVDSWEDPSDRVSKSVYNGIRLGEGAPSVSESFVTGCNLLQFAPEVEYGPSVEQGTAQAGQPTGAAFHLKLPQTNNAEETGTPELKHATVTLPEGMTADPSAAGGLEACSDAQLGLAATVEPAEPASCPSGSQIGTVKVITPLLEKPLEGQAFVGTPECSPCSGADAESGRIFRLFLQVRLPERGVIVKLAGRVSANPTTGRLQATFAEQPQLPFSELVLTLKGGPRAPLANPQTCGTATTTTDLTPWSAPGIGGLSGTEPIEGTPDATPASSFTVDWDGKGGTCPGTLPFTPSFLAQTANSAGGQYTPLSVSFGRPLPATEGEERDEQNLAGIRLNTPGGLLGKIAGVEQCAEALANAGSCPSASEIGTATVGAGAGSHPYYLTGHAYLTGPYKGEPFGLSIAVPAEAGPFHLAANTGTGLEVVRAAIAVNPLTDALTVTSDPLPQIADGVPLRLHDVRVDVSRPRFTLNPTSCATGQQIAGSVTGEPIRQLEAPETVSLASPFATTGCASLPFHPMLTATTAGLTSKADGASLNITISAAAGEANIGKVDLTLPKALPSRLTTLHQACTEAQFAANPAGCPEGSDIGTATARSPLLNAALSGPVYLVSHGNVEFPDVEMVLQGENGLELVLDGQTQITGGITYSRFEAVPDAPITSFETSLPEGPHSIFAAAESLCTAKALTLGATLTGQNGAQTVQRIPIRPAGCPAGAAPLPKPTVKIEKTKVSGSTVRVTLKITAKGRFSVSGAGLRTARRTAAESGTFTLTTSLTKNARVKLRKRGRLRLKIRVGYVPATGPTSSVSTTVTFR